MIRNDSLGRYIQTARSGTTNGKVLKNTQLGSAQTGGSSGGLWPASFGTRPTITGSASLGSQNNSFIEGIERGEQVMCTSYRLVL